MSFLIIGIIMFLIGAFISVGGNDINNDYSKQFESFFNSGKSNPGDTYIIIGVLIALVGILLIVIGVIKIMNKDKISNQSEQADYIIWYCPRCGHVNHGNFCSLCGIGKVSVQSSVNNNSTYVFNVWKCPRCGLVNNDYVQICKCGTQKVKISDK